MHRTAVLYLPSAQNYTQTNEIPRSSLQRTAEVERMRSTEGRLPEDTFPGSELAYRRMVTRGSVAAPEENFQIVHR